MPFGRWEKFLSAFLTQSLYDIFRLDNSKGVWNRYLRNHDVIKADGLVAFDARKVNMSPMMVFMPAFFQFASAQAIFLFARAIINMVKDVFFCEQCQCTIDRRFIHILKSATIIQYTIKGRFMSR